MATTSSMFMYSLSLQAPTFITHAILGQFAGGREVGNRDQHILTAAGARLTLYRVDANVGKLNKVLEHDVFGTIRQLVAFKVAGAGKDYIIISSDSGRIAIVEYLPAENRFKQIHLETFGKSGIRRVIPGQYLAVDAKGRACLLASIEKNKLVYVLNRNANAEITISSPLEAHKPQTLVFALIGLDVGFENPIFAALEVDYSESDQDPSGEAYQNIEKELVYYELDLGLNHVVRKWSDAVDRTANMLFQVPGGQDGPSGVLVCGEENITYRHSNQEALRVAIPRRRGATEDPDRKRYITAGVMHKMRGAFFFLLQTEDGDLFKVTFEMVEDENGQSTGEVSALRIKYFDTTAVATALCILKSGFLFAANEAGDHHLYQFEKLGDDDDREEFSSDNFPADPTSSYTPAYFHPGPSENLALVERANAMHPLISSKVTNLDESDAPQIYSICGSGARSTFRTLRHGLEVGEIVESQLPGVPNAVWTTKVNASDKYDAYIVLSFSNGTLVLSIGETVEEVTDTGFLSSAPTLAIQLLGDEALLQIHPNGIRHILPGGRVKEWPAPTHRSVVAAACNSRQVAIALSSGEVCYFEMDQDGSLAEYNERKEMPANVTALSIGEVPEGKARSPFLAVGCADQTIRILSLEPDSTLENKSIQAVTAPPTSLTIIPMMDSASGVPTPYLHIGLQSGVYIRTLIEADGELSDTRLRFLGPKPVRLSQVSVKNETAVLALSSRPWLGYTDKQTKAFMLTPLDYVPLEWGWNFSSEQCTEGVVGIEAQSLRIFTIEELTSNVLQQSVELAYTPRGFARHPEQPIFYVVGADSNTLATSTREQLLNDPGVVNGDATVLPPESFGYPKGTGHWASSIQVVDPLVAKSVVNSIELQDNEAAVSIAVVPLASQQDEAYLFVGTGKDIVMNPPSFSCGFIHTYRIKNEGREIEFIHKTKVEAPPRALIAFQGRLLAGIGPHLRIFDLGIRQLLRKAQALDVVPNTIVGLQTQGSRIICSDVQDSVTFVVYKHNENLLLPFADDTVSRWTTCAAMVDYETVAGGDKFGNLWLVRCPQKASEEADEEGSAAILIHEKGYLQGTPNRLELMGHFFTSDLPTYVQKTPLVPGGRDILFWSGIQGTLGVLIPFVTRDEVDFFQTIETQVRTEDPPLAGRDHLTYRGSYAAVKGVIDGDMCERFYRLSRDAKERIAGEVERSVREVERRISDMRTRVAF